MRIPSRSTRAIFAAFLLIRHAAPAAQAARAAETGASAAPGAEVRSPLAAGKP